MYPIRKHYDIALNLNCWKPYPRCLYISSYDISNGLSFHIRSATCVESNNNAMQCKSLYTNCDRMEPQPEARETEWRMGRKQISSQELGGDLHRKPIPKHLFSWLILNVSLIFQSFKI